MKKTAPQKTASTKQSLRPPIIAVMGHIDHGKSSLLDYIRKTNIIAKEAGGITQHVSAYEVIHTSKDGEKHTITFLDTPGHEAFQSLRMRGVQVADIAVLVVSAEDGVKPQTLDALKCIKESGVPFIVAINKIDLPNANIEYTKQSLAENEIFIEGYGGDIPTVSISAKTGEGVNDLLDMMLLVAEIEELTANHSVSAEGVVLESNLDPKKGITATLIIQNGTISQGMFVVAGKSISPIRIMENFMGKNIKEATFSSPIRVIGWNILPAVGTPFKTFATKKEAELYATQEAEKTANEQKKKVSESRGGANERVVIPLIIRADMGGSLEAVVNKISQLKNDQVEFSIIQSGIGAISETDIKLAIGDSSSFVVGFHTKADPLAISLAERSGVTIYTFDIIYKLLEWLEALLNERKPHVSVEESTGKARIAKIFSTTKDKHVIGGKVESGMISVGSQVKILRRDAEIGNGRIRGLQRFKEKASEVEEGVEFGALIESKIELAPGDRIESVRVVEKQL